MAWSSVHSCLRREKAGAELPLDSRQTQTRGPGTHGGDVAAIPSERAAGVWHASPPPVRQTLILEPPASESEL